jgi:ABC-type uncharacterized transport system auxiliary subunit
MTLTRRSITLAMLALPGCSALGALNDAALPRDTYALQPVTITGQGRRSSRTLLVLEPTAPAAIAIDRILIRQDPLSVTYLPDERWADTVPSMLQSILIQSLASSGQIGFVGAQGAGPVPDAVLLTRIDDFSVNQQADRSFDVRVSFELTVLRDRDQRVLGTRRFATVLPIADDQARTITLAFQEALETLLPQALTWVLAQVG